MLIKLYSQTFRTIKPTAAGLDWDGYVQCKSSTDSIHCAQFTKGSQAGVELGSALPTQAELSAVCQWTAPEFTGQGFASTTWLSHSQVPTCYLAQANWNQPREKPGFKFMNEPAEVTEFHSTDQSRNNNFHLSTLWKEDWSAKSRGVVAGAGFCTYLRDDGDLEPQVMEPNLCNINPINNNFTCSCFINPKQTQSEWGFSSSCSSNYSNLLGRNTRTTYSGKELKHFYLKPTHCHAFGVIHTPKAFSFTLCFTSQLDLSLDQFFSNIKNCCFSWLIHLLPSAHSNHLRWHSVHICR